MSQNGETFTCKCGHSGPIEDFVREKKRKPFECKPCKRKRSKKSYRTNIGTYQSRAARRRFEARQLIENTKSGSCMDCGGKLHYCQMDFDHRDQSQKKKPISRLHQAGMKILLEEIEKCDLVCANCHRDRTQKQAERARIDKAGLTKRQELTQKTNEFVNSLKAEKICADCGDPHPYWRLDFDHREDKVSTVSKLKLGCYSKERILEEVAKCDLVCANCHRLRTWNRQRQARMGPT